MKILLSENQYNRLIDEERPLPYTEKDRKLYAVLGKRKLLQKVRDAFLKRSKKK
jgi:hypothetical protein